MRTSVTTFVTSESFLRMTKKVGVVLNVLRRKQFKQSLISSRTILASYKKFPCLNVE